MTKIWIVLFICGLATVNCFGQQNTCDSLFTVVDQRPIYRTGMADVYEYIAKKLTFKKPCGPEGIRQLIWTIDKEGKMIDIDVIGLEGQCKTDVIKQLTTFPTWTPGRLRGELVCVKMIIPVHIDGQ
jgi:hypothetical protein